MGLRYKVDILAELKAKGYNTNRLRKEKLMAESTIQKFRTQKGVAWIVIEQLCALLDCQPGDILEYEKE